MNSMQKIDLVYNPKNSFRDLNPFILAFCHDIENNDYLLTGGLQDVAKFIENTKIPTYSVQTIYHKGKRRGPRFAFYNVPVRISFLKSANSVYGAKPIYRLTVLSESLHNPICLFMAEYGKIPSSFPRDLKSFLNRGKWNK